MSYYNNAGPSGGSDNGYQPVGAYQPPSDSYQSSLGSYPPTNQQQPTNYQVPNAYQPQNDVSKNTPPAYHAITVNTPTPYIEPSHQPVQTSPISTTSTTPSITDPIPQYPRIPGVYDIIPPTYLVSPIPRDILTLAEPLPFSREEFENDKEKGSCCTCCDGCLAIMGLIGLALVLVFVFVTIFAGFGLQIMAVPFGALFLIFYIIAYICATYMVCGRCCGPTCYQSCLHTPYFSTVFLGSDSSTASLKKTIEQISNDIPQLVFHVQASHQTGSGKNRHTVITYSQDHTIPILHYRHVGVDADTFLNSLDQYISGDLSIQFIPKLVLHPDQHDYILKFKQMVFNSNRHRDVTVRVTPFIRAHNNTVDPQTLAKHVAYINDTVTFIDADNKDLDNLIKIDDSDREPRFSTYTEQGESRSTSFPISLATSVGTHTEIYHSNGATSSCCLRFLTSPFTWCLGTLFCMASCLICCWHCRYEQAKYHNTFHVLFPKYEHVVGPYNNQMTSFHTTIPILQTSLSSTSSSSLSYPPQPAPLAQY
jgi:hypothetical protein